jgi:hypothetical protein
MPFQPYALEELSMKNRLATGWIALVALLALSPAAFAQATRTWVSGVGDDANPCSRTAPCKTFAGAISKTATSGEIDCLDPGGFGALTITKSITINCHPAGGIGGVLVSGTNGINVAGGTQVQLIGLEFDGLTTGLNAILVSANSVNVGIIDCIIYGFQSASSTTGAGVSITGTSSKVYIRDTYIRNNNAGVNVAPASGAASVELDHVIIDNNSTTVPASLSGGLIVGTGGVAILNQSTLTSAPTAVSNAGTVFTYQNNLIRGTISGTALTPQTSQ